MSELPTMPVTGCGAITGSLLFRHLYSGLKTSRYFE